jgi:hypothetical protein
MKIELTPEELAELLKDRADVILDLNKNVEVVCDHPGEAITVKKFYVCLKCAKILETEGCK